MKACDAEFLNENNDMPSNCLVLSNIYNSSSLISKWQQSWWHTEQRAEQRRKKTLQNNSCDDSSNNKITNIRANSCRYFKFINTVDRWTTTVATTNTYQFVFSNRTTLQSFKAGCCYCSHWRLEYFTHYTRAYMRYDSQNLIFLYIFCQ